MSNQCERHRKLREERAAQCGECLNETATAPSWLNPAIADRQRLRDSMAMDLYARHHYDGRPGWLRWLIGSKKISPELAAAKSWEHAAILDAERQRFLSAASPQEPK